MQNTNTKTCTIENCEKSGPLVRGWCSMHYTRWKTTGDPLKVLRVLSKNPEEALLSKTIEKDGCILWTGAKTDNGYGLIRIEDKNVRVHRYVWEKHNGKIPNDLFIDHICHTVACCNIKHLRLATRDQNQAHRSGANQSNTTSGVRNVYKKYDRWIVVIMKDGKNRSFGVYDTIEEAAEVAEQARFELFGEFAGRG